MRVDVGFVEVNRCAMRLFKDNNEAVKRGAVDSKR
jgi:hypothetical protein